MPYDEIGLYVCNNCFTKCGSWRILKCPTCGTPTASGRKVKLQLEVQRAKDGGKSYLRWRRELKTGIANGT